MLCEVFLPFFLLNNLHGKTDESWKKKVLVFGGSFTVSIRLSCMAYRSPFVALELKLIVKFLLASDLSVIGTSVS